MVEGILPGVIAEQPRGVGGFGYDPVFYPLDYDKHLTELDPEEKTASAIAAKLVRSHVKS